MADLPSPVISAALGAEFVVDFTLIVIFLYWAPKSVLPPVVLCQVSVFIAPVISPTAEL